MPETLRTAALWFEADGFDTHRPNLLGRHVAGSGFLRAAVAARGDSPLLGCGLNARDGQAFATMVKASDPGAETRWIHPGQAAELAAAGVLYRPDPLLARDARLRLRSNLANHSICGVTPHHRHHPHHGRPRRVADRTARPMGRCRLHVAGGGRNGSPTA